MTLALSTRGNNNNEDEKNFSCEFLVFLTRRMHVGHNQLYLSNLARAVAFFIDCTVSVFHLFICLFVGSFIYLFWTELWLCYRAPEEKTPCESRAPRGHGETPPGTSPG